MAFCVGLSIRPARPNLFGDCVGCRHRPNPWLPQALRSTRWDVFEGNSSESLDPVVEEGLVDELIKLAERRGRQRRDWRRRIAEVIFQLEAISGRTPNAAGEPWTGTYSVLFVRLPRPRARSSLRAKLARFLFKTRYLFQHVREKDNLIVNTLQFRLLGVLSGAVILRGALTPQQTGRRNTIKAEFDAPRLTLGRAINLVVGARSSATLTTTYTSSTIRIGRGKRGSVFVFRRGSAPASVEEANAWRVHLASQPMSRVSVFGALVLFCALVWVVAWLIGLRVALAASMAFSVAMYFALRKDDNVDHVGDLDDTDAVEGLVS